MGIFKSLSWLVLLVSISGCAFNLATIKYEPVELTTDAVDQLPGFILTDALRIYNAPCNYDRTLLADTRWIPVGSIPLGDVYRSDDQSLTVECSNVYEAYLVVADDMLVGGYLPVEDSYVRLKEPLPMNIRYINPEDE